MKVTLYVRERGTRKYTKVKSNLTYRPDTIFCIRYGQKFETLDVTSVLDAEIKRIERQLALAKGWKPADVTPRPAGHGDSLMLDAAIDQYLKNAKLKSKRTDASYTYTMNQFYESCGNKPVASVTKQDLINFVAFLREEELSDRTVHNRVVEVITFLRHNGIKEIKLRVKFTEKKVRAYRTDELEKLFAAADPEEWVLYQFFLCTGAREQEVMNAQYDDLDFVDGLFNVREKADWKPKDYEEREIPIPDFLLESLKKWSLETTSNSLIFPTKDGKRDGHMLRKLQKLAKRAGLPGEWGLHKFRKTYATLQHRSGVDARTIQKRLGHSDLATTLAYLEGEDARSGRSRSQVNDTFGKFALPVTSQSVNAGVQQ